MLKRLLVVLAALVVVSSGHARATERGDGDGSLGDGGIDATIEVEYGADHVGGTDSGGGGDADGPDSWLRVTYRIWAEGGWACPHRYVEVVTRVYADGREEPVTIRCLTPPFPWELDPAIPGPAGPPEPGPTADEVRESAPLPTVPTGINPRVRGLTGLQTWLWYPGDLETSITLDLSGYHVTVRAEAVEFRWRTGDGGTYTSRRAGSEDRPAATHVYADRGRYDVVVSVTWAGSYTFTAPDGSVVTRDLGTTTTSARRRYDVVEEQAVRNR